MLERRIGLVFSWVLRLSVAIGLGLAGALGFAVIVGALIGLVEIMTLAGRLSP